MLLWIVSGAARYIDLTDTLHVSASANVLLNLGAGLEVNKSILLCPLATSVLAVAHEETISQRRVDLLALLNFTFGAWEVTDFASELQRFPIKFVTHTLHVWHGALFAINMRVIGI